MKRAQWIRHTVQSAIWLTIIGAPFFAWRHQHFLTPSRTGESTAPFLTGNTWAAQIGAFTIVDPLAALESTVARHSIMDWGLLLAVIVPVLATLILGRVFCSWVCPAGALFELTQFLRSKLRRLGFSPREVRRPPERLRYLVLAMGVGVTAILGIPVLCHLYPPAIVARETHRLVTSHLEGHLFLFTGGLIFLFILLALELTLSTRFWCRYVCPGGALYSLIGKRRLVRVRHNPDACTQCMDCVIACPVGLDPVNETLGAACDNCLACVSSCNDQALSLVLSTHETDPETQT